MKIEIEHEGSCLGATGGTGRLIVRDALAQSKTDSCAYGALTTECRGRASLDNILIWLVVREGLEPSTSAL
jgi:hypothetical protein